MKKQFCTVVLASIMSWSTLTAQTTALKNALHAKVNLVDYRALNDGKFKPGQGFEVGFFHNVNRFINIGVPLKASLASVPQSNVNTLFGSADALVHIGKFSPSSKFVPYVFGGAGIVFEHNNGQDIQIPFGLGAHYRVSEYAYLNFQGEYRKAMVADRNNFHWGLGYVYLLHKSAVETPLVEQNLQSNKESQDADSDGTVDILDHCPNQFGPAIALGCPDADLDSIADFEDRCPDAKGTFAMGGCPDTDAEGFADLDDKCAGEYGTVRGCPDKDTDGFPDKEDQCPEQAGRWMGCPDTDFDGVPDKDDKCITEPGTPERGGCPLGKLDTDNDTYPDDLDKCPTVAGTLVGCPDADGDGFADHQDKCPQQKGALNGCPDRDGDGFNDSEDPCPDQKGSNGPCPLMQDTDGDGITDALDKCPNLAASGSLDGCPAIQAHVKERLEFAKLAVQFETNKATLKNTSYKFLDEVFSILVENPSYKLVISGHTDDIGDDAHNLVLSTERAKTCQEYFIYKGIVPERIRHHGYGEYKPIADNATIQGRDLNRRVEFEIVFE